MAVESLAQVLLRMVREDEFAKSVLASPEKALSQYRQKLTEEEFKALSQKIPPDKVDRLRVDPHVGAWTLLVHHIKEIPEQLRQELNRELAKRATQGIAIPVTGS